MLPDVVLDRFIEHCPAVVMVRATLENLLRPERLDQIFEDTAERQYSRELLFSELVAVMSAVALRTHRSVRAAYLDAQGQLGVSATAVYDKLNRLEPAISAALIRETATDAAAVIDAMPQARLSVLPGREVFFLDGNHLAASEHRLAVTRVTREGPLPGQTLALLDAQRGLIVDLEPCEDGHAQERALLPALQQRLPPKGVVVADRNFCTTKFLFGMQARGVRFVIRQHGSTLNWKLLGQPRSRGRCDTGTISEQQVELTACEETLRLRRITVTLDQPTESGDTQIHILTNLTPEEASAADIAAAYRQRWTIEGAFQQLTDILRCEVETLGYPKAALFAFATAVLAYNTYAVVKAALRSAQGAEAVEKKLSDSHLMHHVAQTHAGMTIAVPHAAWVSYQHLSARSLARKLMQLARRVDLARYPKSRRGPKKPRPPRKSGSRNHHVATSRLLNQQHN
jgi:IS4 transposase